MHLLDQDKSRLQVSYANHARVEEGFSFQMENNFARLATTDPLYKFSISRLREFSISTLIEINISLNMSNKI